MLVPELEMTMGQPTKTEGTSHPDTLKGDRAATCNQGPDITTFHLFGCSKTSPSPPNFPLLNVSVKTMGEVGSHPGPSGRC